MQSATLDRRRVFRDEMADGATLRLKMETEPNTEWGAAGPPLSFGVTARRPGPEKNSAYRHRLVRKTK